MSQDVRDELSSSQISSLYDGVNYLLKHSSKLILEMTSKAYKRDLKSDQSFVTEVDFAVEDLIREFVLKKYPTHGIVGEERDDINHEAEFQWITDPVDGTQNLVHGVPTYGVVIGVYYKGRPVAGGITHPCFNLSYSAAYKMGTFSGEREIIIEDSELINNREIDPQEILALSTRACFKRVGEEGVFDEIMREHPSTRVYYDIFSTTRAVEGQIAAVIEFGMKIWDIAATEILVTEAGGAYEVVREVDLSSELKSFSIIAGKPSVVRVLKEKMGGFKKYKA